MSQFAKRLRIAMDDNGFRQADIIRITGLSSSHISQYLSGKRNPKQENIYLLASALGVSPMWLMGKDDKTDNHILSKVDTASNTIRIPILGTVAAGYNYFAEQNYIGELQAEGTLSPGGDELFALQIKGDSMSPRIMEGDTVIVSKTAKIDTGDIVIALVNGEEATCKRLQKFTGGIALVPLNPNYQPMFFSDEQIETLPVKIIGKVIENRQKF